MSFLVHTSKTRTTTVKIAVSGFSWCDVTCILTHSEPHNGLVRARDANLSTLTSETMWYQPWFNSWLSFSFFGFNSWLSFFFYNTFTFPPHVESPWGRWVVLEMWLMMIYETREVVSKLSKSSYFKSFLKFENSSQNCLSPWYRNLGNRSKN